MASKLYDLTNDKDVDTMYEKTGEMIGDYYHMDDSVSGCAGYVKHDDTHNPKHELKANETITPSEDCEVIFEQKKKNYLYNIRDDNGYDADFINIQKSIDKKNEPDYFTPQEQKLLDSFKRNTNKQLLSRNAANIEFYRNSVNQVINLRIRRDKIKYIKSRIELLDDIYTMELNQEQMSELGQLDKTSLHLVKLNKDDFERRNKTLEIKNETIEANNGTILSYSDYQLFLHPPDQLFLHPTGGKGKSHSKRRLKRKRTKKRKSSKKRKQSKKSRK